MKNETKPLISILIPTFNSELTIEKCLKSLLSQTYENFEILICDCFSNDNTKQIIKKIKDSRIHFYEYEKGVSKQRNFLLNKSRGEYVTFVDSDDYVNDTYLENFLITKGLDNLDIVFPSIHYVGANNQQISADVTDNKDLDFNSFFELYFLGKITLSPAKFFKRQIVNNVFFNEQLQYGEDLLFLLNLISKYKTLKAGFACNCVYFYLKNSTDFSKYSINKQKTFVICLNSFLKQQKNDKNFPYFRKYVLTKNFDFFKLSIMCRNFSNLFSCYKIRIYTVFKIRKIKKVIFLLFPMIYYVYFRLCKGKNNI